MGTEKSSAIPIEAASGSDVFQKINQVVSNEDISQRQIASESGLSQTTISQYLKGSYPGDVGTVEVKLAKWLRFRKRKSKSTKILRGPKGWASNPTAQKIMMLLEYCHMAGIMGLIFGASGTGKSRTIENYRETYPNVWVAVMSGAHGSVGAALEEIALAIGLKEIPGRPARLLREIIRALTGTMGLLVIDEAQHLTAQALEAIRAIHDSTGCGLILCGNELVHAKIAGGRRAALFAQIFSRIGKSLRIVGSQKADVAAIAGLYGVKSDSALKCLWDIGRKPGALRSVTNVLRLASVMALGEDRQDLDEDLISSAWGDLVGESSLEG